MEKRSSAVARIVAALALVAAVVVVIGIVAKAMDESSSSSHRQKDHPAKQQTKHRTKAKTYTVESGDTLTAIAHKTGVPVAEILALNPEVDPQILIAGQTLKLR
jgi:LysM repeat protein